MENLEKESINEVIHSLHEWGLNTLSEHHVKFRQRAVRDCVAYIDNFRCIERYQHDSGALKGQKFPRSYKRMSMCSATMNMTEIFLNARMSWSYMIFIRSHIIDFGIVKLERSMLTKRRMHLRCIHQNNLTLCADGNSIWSAMRNIFSNAGLSMWPCRLRPANTWSNRNHVDRKLRVTVTVIGHPSHESFKCVKNPYFEESK